MLKKNYFLNRIDEVNDYFKNFIKFWIIEFVVYIIGIVFVAVGAVISIFLLIPGIGLLIAGFIIFIKSIIILIKIFKFQSKIETDYNLYLHDKIDNNDEKENYKQERFEKILSSLATSKKIMSILFWITWFLGWWLFAVIFLILTRSKINSYNNIIIDSFKDQ